MKMSETKDYVGITVGVILVAVALEYFYIPNNIAAGGVTGLAIVINYYIPILPASLLVLIMNGILFLVAFIFIGGNFGGKTIYASISLSVIMWLIESLLNPVAVTTDLIIATIFGTLLTAVGMAIVFNCNASTGGTDILAKIINKFVYVDIGKSLLMVDFVVTFLGAITFGIDIGLYALLAVIISGISIDKFIDGFNSCKEITIISQENNKIADYITKELGRGFTYIKAIGGFTNKDINILYTVLSRNEFIKLKQFIGVTDEKAFITVGEVHEVMGEGFKNIE